MKHKFFWVDAFTEKRFGGNPCAVVFAADELSDEQMLSVAKEMNLSETAFVVRSDKADFGARYFTPAEEIPLAGHPTLSTIHALIEAGEIELRNKIESMDITKLAYENKSPDQSADESATKRTEVSLELKAGVVNVEIFAGSESRPRKIVMSQRKPEFLSTHDPKTVAALFGLEEWHLLSGVLPQTVSTGTPQLMIPVKSKEILQKAAMNVAVYETYKEESDFFSPHLFCLEGATTEGATFARHFGVPPDTLEDPFTGSATGGMAAYLWHYSLIKNPRFIAEQGHWMGRPGQAFVEVVGAAKNIETVKVGGHVVTVAFGEIEIE